MDPGPDAPRIETSYLPHGMPRGVLLETLDRAGTPEVVLVLRIHRDVMGIGHPRGWLDYLTNSSDAVLVADVTSIKSSVTDTGDWITSLISARVVDVLKGPRDWDLAAGDMSTWRRPGGQVTLEHTRVTAVDPHDDLMRVSRRYLVFAPFDGNGDILGDAASLFERQGRRWRSLDISDDQLRPYWDAVERVDPEEALQRIRTRAARER